jgi:hypothetical protein
MANYVPALPDVQRYTHWSDVPDGLFTKTQLAEQGLKPAAEPVGQVLYHGNCYAPLYERASAVAKRPCTPAQRAVLDRARELQRVCRRCGTREGEPLGKGRWCAACTPAARMWEQHVQAQALARELVVDPAAVLLVVDVEPDSLPQAHGVAVVGIRDRAVLLASPAGGHGTPERDALLEQLGVLLADRCVVEEPDYMGPSSRYPHALLSPTGPVEPGRNPHPWVTLHWNKNPSVARIWAGWFAWTDRPDSTHPCVPSAWGGGIPLAWTRSLDLVADGLSMAGLLHRIADGTEPVWEKAAWLVDGYGEPDLSGVRRRKTEVA